MELKSLEIYGFKSFASRTKIKFNKGITGIVGPNGSGKSNIVDAIMWGLGVQSAKQLRGQRMEDVIFAGTSKKKPLNFAEVILTFDNSNHLLDIGFEEVSIKRKIYRSGESEFYINQQKVRLKDIQELFMDTGIGRDGYSFIGQGQIDAIINSKPVDRRQVFEEAAGITKYKKRKEESIRSLAKTEENLQRLNDILGEIKSQHEHLRVESERAQEFNGYKEERDLSNGSYLYLNLNRLDEKSEEIRTKLEEVIASRELYESKLEENLEQSQGLNAEIHEKKDEDQKLQEERLELTQKFQSTKSKIENTRDLMDRMSREQSTLLDQREELALNLKELERDQDQASKSVEMLEHEVTEKTNAFQLANRQFDEDRKKVQEAKAELASLQDDLQSVHTNRTQLESKIDAYKYMINERKDRYTRLEQARSNLTKQLHELEHEYTKEHDAREKLATEIESVSNECELTFEALNQLNTALGKLQEKSVAQSKHRDRLQQEISFLKRMQENHEGYSSAVKRFLKMMENYPWSSSVIGTVAESLHIKEPFHTAISTTLGGAAQNIILTDDHSIGEMLNLLKSNKLGRVTFLPLNTINPNPIRMSSLPKVSYPVYLGCDCVEVSSELRPITEFLLGRVLIVESVANGRDLSRKVNRRYRIVTLDGQVFNVGGSITGGSQYQGQKDLFNRKSQIHELEQNLNQFEEEMHHLATEIHKLEDSLESRQKQSELLHESKVQLERELTLSAQSIEKYEQSIEDYKSRQSELEDEIQRESEEIESRQGEVAIMLQKLDDNQVHTDSEQLSDLTQWVEEHEHLLNLKRDELGSAEVELTKTQGSLKYAREHIQNLAEKQHNYSEQVQSIDLKAGELQREIQELSQNEVQLKEEYEQLDQKLKASEELLLKIRALIDELEMKVDQLQLEQQEMQVNLRKLERKEENLTMNYQTTREQLAATRSEFDAMPQEIRHRAVENQLPIEKLKKIIREMDAKIEALGYINFNAIEEFAEIDERYHFILNQQEDLNLSKDKLEKVIQRLDREMTTIFKATMEEVQVYFEEIFEQLFQGGQASIELVNEDNILESGIEITAQPPGKKLQSLTLLSGGERSMTAVALLFALLKKRKSPFCILDEIDAALDEANIARYTNYLKQLEDIQFIMITHRKSTMEIAESLYGITMEEKGISSVISMKLEE